MKIVICGDSTAAVYDPEVSLHVGWGQALPEFLPEGYEVVNHAMAGRSTKSFLAEGRLDRALADVEPGDLLLIQFGHNDASDKPERHTEPREDFTANLTVFLEEGEKRGARPALMTPICIRNFENGELMPSHGEYLKAVRALAEKRGVPLIDLYEDTFRIVREAGEEESKKLYMCLEKGEDSRYPEGLSDTTHTRRTGAVLFAEAAAGHISALCGGNP